MRSLQKLLWGGWPKEKCTRIVDEVCAYYVQKVIAFVWSCPQKCFDLEW
jgi:hypothetical protein